MTKNAMAFGSSLLLLFALSSPVVANVVTFPVYRYTPPADSLGNDLDLGGDARASIPEQLYNNVTGGSYMANVSIGTPPQAFSLVIDTGSSDVFVLAATADQCTKASVERRYGPCVGGTFDNTKSSTYKIVKKGGFSIQYVDNSQSSGDYFSDTFEIGGAKLASLQMGLAFETTVGVGIMGIGYSTGESVTSVKDIYPNIIDQMVAQNQINIKLYSLYLNDLQTDTGSIIFGGIDTKKFVGTLKSLPVQPEAKSKVIRSFTVLMTSMSFTNQDGNTTALTSSTFSVPVILDSGTTLTYVPSAVLSQIINKVGGVLDPGGSGIVLVDCDLRTKGSNAFISFGFGGSGGPIINVPVSEVIRSLRSTTVTGSPFKRSCSLGIRTNSIYLLGDTFLRSAYVVYDLKNNMVALAQANFESTDSNVVEVSASATAIPLLTGVATGLTQVPLSHFLTDAATSTATAKTTGTATVVAATATGAATGTGTSPGTNPGTPSPGAKSGAVSTFDSRGLVTLAISALFALVGGSWVLIA